MFERIEGRAPVTIPPSLVTLTNEFIMEGVVSLLLPPSDLLTKWVATDPSFTEQERASMYDFIAISDGGGHTVMPVFDPNAHEALQEQTAMFGAALANRFHGYILETVLPLFFNGQFNLDPEQPVMLTTKFQDIQPLVEDTLHDFVLWVESRLESAETKQVLHELNGLHHWDKREQIIDDLMERHEYKRVRVVLAKERLMRMFARSLDNIIEDVAVNLKSGMHAAFIELAEKDRENIPGPRHLE